MPIITLRWLKPVIGASHANMTGRMQNFPQVQHAFAWCEETAIDELFISQEC
jgi:hypothetical protein